jgi:tetratricopeptide (TPR) repeat protein
MRSAALGLGVALIFCAVRAHGQTDAAQRFEQAKALLAKGDFSGALEAFKAATKAEPENSEYFQEFTLLRRVLNIREQLKAETDPETWQKMSRALYNYYCQHRVHGEALAIARAMYDKAGSGDTAALLAEAQLEAGENAAAATVLGQLDEAQRTLPGEILRGIALVRLDQRAAARAIAAQMDLPKDSAAAVWLLAARLLALVGSSDEAIANLTRAFECTPPNELAALRADAQGCADLETLKSNPAFGSALETKSKVKAADCGKCPNRGKDGCGLDKKKRAGCNDHEQKGQK